MSKSIDKVLCPEVIIFLIMVAVVMGSLWIVGLVTPDISKAKPIDDSLNTAYLYVQKNLTLVSFNGKKIKKRTSPFWAKTVAVNVPVGVHTFIVDFKKVELGITGSQSTLTAKGFELKATFEDQKYYYVNWTKTKDKKISVFMRETEEGVFRASK